MSAPNFASFAKALGCLFLAASLFVRFSQPARADNDPPPTGECSCSEACTELDRTENHSWIYIDQVGYIGYAGIGDCNDECPGSDAYNSKGVMIYRADPNAGDLNVLRLASDVDEYWTSCPDNRFGASQTNPLSGTPHSKPYSRKTGATHHIT